MKTEAELKKSIEDLNTNIEETKEILSKLNLLQRNERIELYKLQSGLTVGDDVEFKDGCELKRGQIISFHAKYSWVSPIVSLYKKDGTVGERTKDSFYNHSELKKL